MVQEKLKEKKYNKLSFIGGWYIPNEICDGLLDYFNFNKKYQGEGKIGEKEEFNLIDKKIKESTDLSIGCSNFDVIIGEYRDYLQICLQHYLKKYEYADKVSSFSVFENMNIQHYPVSGGYKSWHFENVGDQSIASKRHLVFMTYLNDVEDGGTEFFYQNMKTKAEKGLTLIWPSIWTHVHRGIVSNTKEKTILTGWFSFN